MHVDPSPTGADPSMGPGTNDVTASARRRAQQAGEKVMTVLPRLIPLACRVAAFIKVLAVVSLVAVAIIVLAVLSMDVPRTLGPWLLLLAMAAVLLFPPVVLWLFYRALEEVLELPNWLKSSPDLARQHGAELADLVRAARGEKVPSLESGAPTRRQRRGKDVWRSGRLLLEARKDLPGYGSVLRLISPPFLFLVLIAFAGAWTEILLSGFAVIVALVSRLF